LELGGIEPPSIRLQTSVLRPFPTHSLSQRDRRVGWPSQGRSTLGLCRVSADFHAVSGLSRRHPPLLLPGCGGSAPCAISGHDVSSLT